MPESEARAVIPIVAPESWEHLLEERDELRLRLDRQSRELDRVRRDLQQFAHAASHDLFEPLRLISGFAQLLQTRYHGALDPKADSFIDVISNEIKRMQAMIQGLTEFSRVESRAIPFVSTPLDEPLDLALLVLRSEIEHTGARILRAPLPTIPADPTQMVTLFHHLIGNALRFRGDQSPLIQIRAEKQDHAWLIQVTDNGIGIPAKFAERVFIVFQKLHPHGKYPGIGIGLAVTRRIVERHGGRIWVESREEPGTTLCLALPESTLGIPP
ncbi:MAG: hypothetical protein HQL97_00605 [Magnetococcales bacterium]|nr:hypothetical protein [Magnetococcales bacterium]